MWIILCCESFSSAKGASPYQPGATLGICAWSVKRRILLKRRVLQNCHYHMVAFHANSKPKTLIEAVRAKRIALGISLRQFSKIIGRNMWSISEWENGRARPRASGRKLLIDWLGYDPESKPAYKVFP